MARLARVVIPGMPHQITQRGYDADGNLLSTVDPDNHTTWTVYDALNRPVQQVSALGSGPTDTAHMTTTDYDQAGNVSSVTDPDANTTFWTYDDLGRKLT